MKLQTTKNQLIKNNQECEEDEDWFIVFNDGSTKKITHQQAQQIFKLSGEPSRTGIKINGGYYKFSSFAKIIPSLEYYFQYPDRGPVVLNYTYPNGLPKSSLPLPKDQVKRILSPIKQKEKRLSALKNIKKGLLKYINSSQYQGTNKPKKLLQKVEYKIKTL